MESEHPIAGPAGLPWLGSEEQSFLEVLLNRYATFRLSRGDEESSVSADERIVVDFLSYSRGLPGSVNEGDFEAWAAHLRLERDLTGSSQRKYQGAVRGFFAYLSNTAELRRLVQERTKLALVQPATAENCIVHRNQVERDEDNPRLPLSRADMRAVLRCADEEIQRAQRVGSKNLRPAQRDKAIICCMRWYMLRPSELVRLDYDWFTPNAKFPQLGSFAQLAVFGKGRKWRTVTLLEPGIVPVLEWYVTEVRPHFLLPQRTESALFLTERGARMSYSALYDRVKRLFRLAGLSARVVPHCLRHTGATENSQDGLSLEANRQQLGHEYAATTQHYIGVPDSFAQRQFSNIINK